VWRYVLAAVLVLKQDRDCNSEWCRCAIQPGLSVSGRCQLAWPSDDLQLLIESTRSKLQSASLMGEPALAVSYFPPYVGITRSTVNSIEADSSASACVSMRESMGYSHKSCRRATRVAAVVLPTPHMPPTNRTLRATSPLRPWQSLWQSPVRPCGGRGHTMDRAGVWWRAPPSAAVRQDGRALPPFARADP
jgi:hypothetical protein